MLTRLLLAVYFIETGTVLLVAPWTIWWRRNFFADLMPWLSVLMTLSTIRFGVVAAGGLTLAAGVREAADLIRGWRAGAERSGGGLSLRQ